MAREIARDSKDGHILEEARIFAAAELDLARVRRLKVALIERVRTCGALERPQPFRSGADATRFFEALDQGIFALSESVAPSCATIPSEEPHRSAEAIRRVLPELLKLNRYEQRAATRRDEAARQVLLALEARKQL